MLSPAPLPGLFITATDTSVGKTVIAGAIARHLHRRHHLRVAVAKPIATGCVRRREGLVSEDAEFLAHCADSPHPLDLICPQRYAEPLAPAVAADRAATPIDWPTIDNAIRLLSLNSDLLIIEGVGGILVPLDEKHTVLDLAEALRLPTLIVARPGLGTINHTLLTLHALRSRNLQIAGVIINRYPPDTPGTAEETNPRAIERWGKTPVLAIVPNAILPTDPQSDPIPPSIASPIGAVDWQRLSSRPATGA